VDYDMHATSGPSSGVGNGLGGRATSAQLAGYDMLDYSSSYLSVNLPANGGFENDASNDPQVVGNWPAQGDAVNPKPDRTPPAGCDGVPARAIFLEDVLAVIGPSGGTPIGAGDMPAATT
jgi:hypothetical protein